MLFRKFARRSVLAALGVACLCGGQIADVPGLGAGPAAAQSAGDRAQAGVSAAVTGAVQVARAGETVGRQAESGLPIFLQDRVESGADASLQILLLDETVFTVGPESEMVIDRFVYDPGEQSGALAAGLAKGVMRFVTGKIASGESEAMTVEMPMGTIGIRGTRGLLAVLTPEQARAQFPTRYRALTGGGGGQDAPDFVGLAALTGPGTDNDAGAFGGSFRVSTGTGDPAEMSRPGSSTLFVAGAPPLPPFLTPPGALDGLVQRVTQGAAGTGAPQYGGGAGDGTGPGDNPLAFATTEQTGAGQPVSVSTILDELVRTEETADKALEVASSESGGQTFATVDEVLAANTGSVSSTGHPITGALTGSFDFVLDFGNRTLQFDASLGIAGGVSSNGAQVLPTGGDRTLLTFGDGEEFPIDTGSDCTTCKVDIAFPSTGAISASVRNEGKTGGTGAVEF